MRQSAKIAVVGAAVMVMVVAFLFFMKGDRQPVMLPFVGGMSGKFADLGIDCRRGIELAVSRINRSGGIHGRMIEIVTRDDGNDAGQAKAAVEEFLQLNVPVIIGHTTSSMSMETLPLINGSSTLLVSPTTSTPLLKDLDDNFLRTCAVSTDPAIMMARYLRQIMQARRAVVIYDAGNAAYTEHWYRNFATTFLENGGLEVIPHTFSSAPDLQMLPLIHEVRRHDPDVLVIVTNSVDAALLSQQVRKTGWTVLLALADWAATEQLIHLGGKAVEGAVISQYFNRQSKAPQYLAFKKAFESAYRTEPGFGAVHSYNAAMMVFTGMQEQRQEESLKEAILRISVFEGLQGPLVINRFGDSSNPTFMGVIADGAFHMLEEYR